MCYYTNWSQYRAKNRTANANFFPEDIDPTLCTHLTFSFAKIVEVNDTWGIGSTEWNDIGDQWTYGGGLYARLNRLKDSNPGLKVSRIYFHIYPGQILYHINLALDFDRCGWRQS